MFIIQTAHNIGKNNSNSNPVSSLSKMTIKQQANVMFSGLPQFSLDPNTPPMQSGKLFSATTNPNDNSNPKSNKTSKSSSKHVCYLLYPLK